MQAVKHAALLRNHVWSPDLQAVHESAARLPRRLLAGALLCAVHMDNVQVVARVEAGSPRRMLSLQQEPCFTNLLTT